MILEDADFGYDPTVSEPFAITQPQFVAELPAAALVNPAFLPPIGQQGTVASAGYPGSCCAWASTYGLATFTAARAGRVSPALPSGRASPAYIYIQVLKEHGGVADDCGGSQFDNYFSKLKDGTASMASAPYVPDCRSLWLAYANATIPSDKDFAISRVHGIATSDLNSIKQVLASGRALAYGTRLFTDWGTYQGDPSPYWGSGTVLVSKKTGKPAGHCMLIIGYDDSLGAIRLQNSQGTEWGSGGYVWIAYTTFQTLAQGTALYVPD
jgi:hypothetical protein